MTAKAKNEATRYSASRLERSYNTIFSPAPAATHNPAERMTLRSRRKPSQTSAPAYTSHHTLKARSPARLVSRPNQRLSSIVPPPNTATAHSAQSSSEPLRSHGVGFDSTPHQRAQSTMPAK